MSLLSNAEIQKGISDLDGWEYVDGSIKKTFSFDTYMDSISFINLLSKKAEIENKLKTKITQELKHLENTPYVDMTIQQKQNYN